ncbi:MAG TPA: sialidase family protein, partial [Tepidisphaeraceae bacterium]|nr:sialidase family protein [Tepidisphaeraceae bacterium]
TGMSAMRMCETRSGTWLIGSHASHWDGDRPITQQFLLRSEDQGKKWTLIPGDWPNGWQVRAHQRMDEGRPINLSDDRILLMARTPTGKLWAFESADDGKTWSDPRATPLAHPDAPPMLFHLQDGKTLIAFHHNRSAIGTWGHLHRTELWFSISRDDARTWEEPRFVLANACKAATLTGWGGSTPMVSYCDLLVDGDRLHLFVDHQMRQVLYVPFTEADLARFPTASDLKQMEVFSGASQ